MNRLSSVTQFFALILLGYSAMVFGSTTFVLQSGPNTNVDGVSPLDLSGHLIIPASTSPINNPVALDFLIPTPQTSHVYLLKNNGCLDEGVNVVGVGANAAGTPINIPDSTGKYRLALSVDATQMTNPTCNPSSSAPIRTATIVGATAVPGFHWSGTYYTYDPNHPGSLPEPASVALVGLGLAGLALVHRRKRARR